MALMMILIGCLTAESYLPQTVSVACSRSEECQKSTFEDAYDDQAECREDNSEDLDAYTECYTENCDFDAQKAQSCLIHMRTADCDDIYDEEDCNAVFDDCNDLDLAGCIADILF